MVFVSAIILAFWIIRNYFKISLILCKFVSRLLCRLIHTLRAWVSRSPAQVRVVGVAWIQISELHCHLSDSAFSLLAVSLYRRQFEPDSRAVVVLCHFSEFAACVGRVVMFRPLISVVSDIVLVSASR